MKIDGKVRSKLTEYMHVLERLDALRQKLNKRSMSIETAMSLIAVAQNEGLNVSDYARATGIPKNSMSRNLLDLGPRDRHMQPGLGLVAGERSPLNLSHLSYTLTPKGRDFLADLTKGAK